MSSRTTAPWPISKLEDLVNEVTSGATPQSGNPRYYAATGVPFAKIDDLTASTDRFLQDASLRITPAAFRDTAVKVYPAGTILLSMYGTIGLVKTISVPMAANQALAALVPPFRCHPGYLVHFLDWARDRWLASSGQTTQANINGRAVKSSHVPVPSQTEQCRIADILDTLDDTIRKTEEIIAKLEQAKQGLLHDLLTRGIDENGELRDPDRHPEQFKETVLGWLPKTWSVVAMKEVVPAAEYGISSSLSDDGAVPVLRMMNLAQGEVDVSDLKYSNESEAFHLPLHNGDVLFNRTNSMEHVGRTAVWRGQLLVASFASYLVRLLPDPSRLDPEFLNLWLNLPETQLRIRKWATPGVQQVNINPTNLRKTCLALPATLHKQREIVDRIRVHDALVHVEAGELSKLRGAREGLADDLLTGRVRVPEAEKAFA